MCVCAWVFVCTMQFIFNSFHLLLLTDDFFFSSDFASFVLLLYSLLFFFIHFSGLKLKTAYFTPTSKPSCCLNGELKTLQKLWQTTNVKKRRWIGRTCTKNERRNAKWKNKRKRWKNKLCMLALNMDIHANKKKSM